MRQDLIAKDGTPYTPKSELEARALLALGWSYPEPETSPNLVKTPEGWPLLPEEEDARDCVALPEPRKPGWLFWFFLLVLAAACSVMVGAFVYALNHRYFF